MIIGIGTDLTEISRMEEVLQRPSRDRFLARILTEQERAALSLKVGQLDNTLDGGKRAAEYVAGRFAVKEAVSKALGSGIGACLGFQDILVTAERSGRPVCRVSAEALHRLGLDPASVRIHISITHTEMTAGAFAVVEGIEPHLMMKPQSEE
ncbi:holo-ACP synthase [Gorillibacterium sp. CAU 1737]|uniref:holo-ACP synthase n=1 Tax=Gorillibacterium sp. CAU 1737 TaxID=3140362 RepID=UPI003260EC31